MSSLYATEIMEHKYDAYRAVSAATVTKLFVFRLVAERKDICRKKSGVAHEYDRILTNSKLKPDYKETQVHSYSLNIRSLPYRIRYVYPNA